MLLRLELLIITRHYLIKHIVVKTIESTYKYMKNIKLWKIFENLKSCKQKKISSLVARFICKSFEAIKSKTCFLFETVTPVTFLNGSVPLLVCSDFVILE